MDKCNFCGTPEVEHPCECDEWKLDQYEKMLKYNKRVAEKTKENTMEGTFGGKKPASKEAFDLKIRDGRLRLLSEEIFTRMITSDAVAKELQETLEDNFTNPDVDPITDILEPEVEAILHYSKLCAKVFVDNYDTVDEEDTKS